VVDGSARGGDLYMATREEKFLAIRGDIGLATREDFFMATDTGIAVLCPPHSLPCPVALHDKSAAAPEPGPRGLASPPASCQHHIAPSPPESG